MKFVTYQDWQQLPGTAVTLFSQYERKSIFFSKDWLENVSATLSDRESLCLACVIADDVVLAILPLIVKEGNTWSGLKHRYTTHFTLLINEDLQAEIISCLANGLMQLPVRSFLFEPVAENDTRILELKEQLQLLGCHCEAHFRFYNWINNVTDISFDDFFAARPGQLRNTVSRKKRKLQNEHGFEVKIFHGDNCHESMRDYYSVYISSWKANEQFVGFLNSVVESFSHKNAARIGVLYVDNQPIAAQLWFVLGAKANIFRLSYNEKWKKYSVGTILTSYLMEYVIDTDKVNEIDFLTGNESYKQDWMSKRRERFALSCIKPVVNEKWSTRAREFVLNFFRA